MTSSASSVMSIVDPSGSSPPAIAGSEITQLNWEFPVTDTIDSWTVIDDMIVWLGAEHLDVYDDWFRPLGMEPAWLSGSQPLTMYWMRSPTFSA